jgi:putative ABC transport system ATP-binding protein
VIKIGEQVVIKNVRKVYRVGSEKVVALDDVSFSIDEGEVCCFLGTSGSGKSTLLNLLAGLEKPTSGTIEINGKVISKMNEKKISKFRQKHIGFIFQSYNLLPALTAVENVALPLTFRGITKSSRIKRSKDQLKKVGLGKHLKHKPTQMSGGQQQRVGIARAFVSNPEIVFADEPTGNLDSKTTKEIMGMMMEFVRENNRTMILVTHDKTIAEYADKVVYILDGNIVKIEENRNGRNTKDETQ